MSHILCLNTVFEKVLFPFPFFNAKIACIFLLVFSNMFCHKITVKYEVFT